MTVLRRLDAVLDMKTSLDEAGVVEQDPALRQAAGQAFYNTSKFTMRDLKSRANRQQCSAWRMKDRRGNNKQLFCSRRC